MTNWTKLIDEAGQHLESAEREMGITDDPRDVPPGYDSGDASAVALMSIASSLIAIAKMLDYHETP